MDHVKQTPLLDAPSAEKNTLTLFFVGFFSPFSGLFNKGFSGAFPHAAL